MHTTALTRPDDVRDWLTTRLLAYLPVTETELAHDFPLAELGVDSVIALTLCGDIEEELGLAVDDTLVWTYPTPSALARYLARSLAAAG